MVISSPGSTSRTNDAPTMSSAAVSLATTQPRARRPSTSGRKPCGSRAAYRVCSSMNTSEYAPRTSGSVASTLSSTLAIRGSANSAVSTSVSDGGPLPGPAARAIRAAGDGGQFQGVDQVPVVPQRQAGRRGGPERRLRVLPDRRAAGGVPAVADRDVAAQRGQRGLVEHLGHQAHVLVDHDSVAVADRDARGLLAAVLQCVQAEVGKLRYFLARGPHAEHAACVPRGPVRGIYIVRQSAIGGDHLVSLVRPDRCWCRGAAATARTGRPAARWR